MPNNKESENEYLLQQKESSKKIATLCRALMETIQSGQYTYRETIKALKWLLVALQDKGDDLLNGVSIQEVAGHAQHNSVELPR